MLIYRKVKRSWEGSLAGRGRGRAEKSTTGRKKFAKAE
jgi:hypothetical protein